MMSCSLVATRPTQLMSDTNAAIRAAQEVQADTLSPELYRKASELFFHAKIEYKLKNFKLAIDYAEKARRLAEQAEYEAMRNGGNRTEDIVDPLSIHPEKEQPSDSAHVESKENS